MDLVKIVRAYVQQMVDEVQGYKALLLDRETMRVVSTLYGRTELAEHGVVLIERLDLAAPPAFGGAGAGKEHMELKVGWGDAGCRVLPCSGMREVSVMQHNGCQRCARGPAKACCARSAALFFARRSAARRGERRAVAACVHNLCPLPAQTRNPPPHHCQAVVFVRPTRENVTLLKRELRAPRFQGYALFFSHLAPAMHLQDLAEADAARELVSSVHEHYADFVALDGAHFLVPAGLGNDLLLNPRATLRPGAPSEYEVVDRLVQGLAGLCLALRRRPVIRYQRGSEAARRVAESLHALAYRQQVGVFDFGSHRASPVLLLLDRRDDPVTPLLTQWTYEAMVHELLGLRDGAARLDTPRVPEQYRDAVLDAASDDFFARHRRSNYGEVGLAVRDAVERFGAASEQHRRVESLDDMRRFVAEHADFSRAQGVVTKHVNVMSALSEQVSARRLMEVSPVRGRGLWRGRL